MLFHGPFGHFKESFATDTSQFVTRGGGGHNFRHFYHKWCQG